MNWLFTPYSCLTHTVWTRIQKTTVSGTENGISGAEQWAPGWCTKCRAPHLPLDSLMNNAIWVHSIGPGRGCYRNPQYLSRASLQSEPVFVLFKSSIGAHSICPWQVLNRSPQFLSRASPQSEPTVSVSGKSAIGAHSFCPAKASFCYGPTTLNLLMLLLVRSCCAL